MADVSLIAGDTCILDVAVQDQDGAAIDLTGATVRWQMARSVRSSTPTLAKAIGTGIAVTDAEGGLIAITLDPEDTEAITGSFYHEIEVIDAVGNVSTVLSGTVTISPALIHPA